MSYKKESNESKKEEQKERNRRGNKSMIDRVTKSKKKS